MSNFFARIITASAGTGKTYRLSVEYLCLLLKYYEKREFTIDSILVLTFTRKATAEIRERVFKHLQLLISGEDSDARKGLIQSIRASIPAGEDQPADTLSPNEINILISVFREVTAQKNLLQIMTIDSYISAIFRNLIRPVRSIDTYSIDQMAIEKRLPYLMNHLMRPEFREKVDSLLRRRLSPSLDEYKHFFISLVQNRWVFYMITKRVINAGENSLCQIFGKPDLWQERASQELQEAKASLLQIIDLIALRGSQKDSKAPEDHLKAGLRNALNQQFLTYSDLRDALMAKLDSPEDCLKIYPDIIKEPMWHKNDFKKNHPEELELLAELYEKVTLKLANYLVYSYLLPEQEELITIWNSVLQEYDKLIYRYKNMTYDDISWFTFEALFSEEPPLFDPEEEVIANEFYHFLSHRSRFILIDEFQDTSLIQFNILKPIIREVISGEGSKPFGGFIVVGDEKQSIFGWRGGERELLTNLDTIFSSFVKVDSTKLALSWRSSGLIMNFINSIFQNELLHQSLNSAGMNWDYTNVQCVKKELDPLSMLQLKILPYQSNSKTIINTKDDVYKCFVRDMVYPFVKDNKTERCAILCRTGNELGEIQSILDEMKEGSIFQPSANLMEHHLISPILSWLNYVAYGEWQSFLEFIRSDLVMLKPGQLKKAVDAISEALEGSKAPDFGFLPLLETFYQAGIAHKEMGLYQICRQICQICLAETELSERDYLNLQAFMSLVRDYELNDAQGSASIPEFLLFLEENIQQDILRQRSVENSKTLELQTIHKSKGLEYDRVFVFYNLSGRSGSTKRQLMPFIDYEGKGTQRDFENLSDFAATFHYKNILEKSDWKHLIAIDDKREQLEELNTLYVAFTRAKTKLHVFFTYTGSDAWEDYFASKDRAKISLPMILCDACRSYLIQNEASPETEGWLLGNRDARCEKEEVESDKAPETQPEMILPDWEVTSLADLVQDCTPRELHPKSYGLGRSSALSGNVAHFYLSQLYSNSAQEQSYALALTLQEYSSILRREELEAFLIEIKRRLEGFPQLFDPRYDRIYNEFSVYSGSREYRIDRLVLDSKSKVAVIFDYKTGGIHDPEQVQVYKRAIQNLRALHGYEIRTEFIEV